MQVVLVVLSVPWARILWAGQGDGGHDLCREVAGTWKEGEGRTALFPPSMCLSFLLGKEIPAPAPQSSASGRRPGGACLLVSTSWHPEPPPVSQESGHAGGSRHT